MNISNTRKCLIRFRNTDKWDEKPDAVFQLQGVPNSDETHFLLFDTLRRDFFVQKYQNTDKMELQVRPQVQI